MRLREAAAAGDHAGMLAPAQQALIHRRGWLKMLAPRSCGGAEAPLTAAVRLEEAIAAVDGSTGWVVTLCAGAGWFAAFLPPTLAREVVATRRLCIAGSGAPSGFADRDGAGWRIDGCWAHASGAPMATHFTLNAVLRAGGQTLRDSSGAPRIRAFIVPAAKVEVVPTWHSIGLRGTASHSYRIDDQWVPESHAFDIDAAAATAEGPLYRFPFRALAFVTLAANLGGMARNFIEQATHIIAQRKQLSGDRQAGMQRLVQDAQEDLALARQHLYARLDSAWEQVELGVTLGSADAQQVETASLAWVRAAREGVDGLYPYCGLRAADGRSQINRVWRDFHTATQHALLLP